MIEVTVLTFSRFGTYNHLTLLNGRIADFAAKDLKRKRRVIQANGGQWRPPANFARPPGPPGPPNGPPSTSKGNKGPQVPSFPGMLPDTNVMPSLPRGFSPERDVPPEIKEDEDKHLELLTIEAEKEWLEIRCAYDTLREHFGPDFQPLAPEYAPAAETPFGPSLQYRTYGIANIWIDWSWGVILCHRAHPSMPPAAMMAAGVAAPQTALFANDIARAAAGLIPDLASRYEVSTQIGAALIESTMGLFIAGVQVCL